MARIPDGELERLKNEVSLLRLIEVSGVKLACQGKDWACRCPWHEGDDTPSCVITPATNLWHCFGCNAGGSVIDWVMWRHKVSFRHACELLAKEHPALAAGSASAPAPKLSAGKLRTAQTFSLEAGDQALRDQVIEFYHQTLKSSPEALSYLDSRGLGNMALIERFRLGQAMLGHMGLIHMNGRVQDAITGRFLSPDLRIPAHAQLRRCPEICQQGVWCSGRARHRLTTRNGSAVPLVGELT